MSGDRLCGGSRSRSRESECLCALMHALAQREESLMDPCLLVDVLLMDVAHLLDLLLPGAGRRIGHDRRRGGGRRDDRE